MPRAGFPRGRLLGSWGVSGRRAARGRCRSGGGRGRGAPAGGWGARLWRGGLMEGDGGDATAALFSESSGRVLVSV
ncbi:hypothetical protein C5C86_02680, partial [Rathayibacter sp. AY1E4]